MLTKSREKLALFSALAAFVVVVITIIAAVTFSGCAKSQADAPNPSLARPTYAKEGTLHATAGTIAVTSTINKSVTQYSLPFTGNSYSILGAQAPYIETTVNYGTAYTTSNGIGNVTFSNLQMIYLLSDQLDATVAVYSNSSGTGTAISGGTIALTAGVPYEWDTTAGTATAPAQANWASFKVTAGSTATGIASSGTQTNFHARTSLSN